MIFSKHAGIITANWNLLRLESTLKKRWLHIKISVLRKCMSKIRACRVKGRASLEGKELLAQMEHTAALASLTNNFTWISCTYQPSVLLCSHPLLCHNAISLCGHLLLCHNAISLCGHPLLCHNAISLCGHLLLCSNGYRRTTAGTEILFRHFEYRIKERKKKVFLLLTKISEHVDNMYLSELPCWFHVSLKAARER